MCMYSFMPLKKHHSAAGSGYLQPIAEVCHKPFSRRAGDRAKVLSCPLQILAAASSVLVHRFVLIGKGCYFEEYCCWSTTHSCSIQKRVELWSLSTCYYEIPEEAHATQLFQPYAGRTLAASAATSEPTTECNEDTIEAFRFRIGLYYSCNTEPPK